MRAASRRNPNDHHFMAVYGGVGYQTMLMNASVVRSNWGVAPALGFGYRYFRNGFLLQLGIEGEFTYANCKIDDQQLVLPSVDSEGDDFLLHASFTGSKDVIRTAMLHLPVMIGVEHQRFYCLAGAKIGFGIYGETAANTIMTTEAEYDRFFDYFVQMPNHNLEDNVPVQGKYHSLRWQTPSVQLHLELGARLESRLYLGLYADYGLLNIHTNTSLGDRISYAKDENEVWRFTICPSMLSAEMVDKCVNPLVIGVKFTYLFELPKRQKCVLCKE